MRVDIKDVLPGMILDAPIIRDDVLLVKKGGELTPPLINRLKTFGITSIDIVSDKKKLLEEKADEFTVNENLFQEVRDALIENDVEKIENSASDMITAVLNDFDVDKGFSNFKYDLQSYMASDDSLSHSIRVATFSIILAHLFNEDLKKKLYARKEYEDQKVDLKDVAIAALLHDKGKNHYENDVLDKIDSLAKNEKLRSILPGIVDVPTDRFDDKYIPLYSFCQITDIPELSDSDVKYMVLYSSESENKSGPLKAIGFGSDNTESFLSGAKIIHVCSLYDDYLAHCVHSGESLENTVSVVGHAASHGVIDANLTNLFLNNVPIYSVGNKVELSTGELAVVQETFTGYTYTTRPIVKTLSNGEEIDLRDERLITIIGVPQDESSLEDVVNGQLNEIDRRVRR